MIGDREKSAVCLQCLECCRYVSFSLPLAGDLKIYEEFCRVRDLELVAVKKGVVYIRVEKHCKYLTVAGCRIYDQRPMACRMYDGRKDAAMADKCMWKEIE